MGLGRDLAYAIGATLASPVWGYRMLRTGKWRTDWPGRFGHIHRDAAPQRDRRTLLLHAVSVGEVNALRQLVDELARREPDLQLVISTTTDTGYARAIELWHDRHRVVRYPLDFTRAVRRFLDAVQPDAVALTELEVWPNFVAECERRGIPVAVINGRLSARSFGRYRLARPLVRSTFARLAAAAVQTPAYAERFAALGVPADRVHVLDTMKWDTARLVDHVEGADELARDMGIDRDRPLVVAGSTGPGEEAMLLEQCPPDVQLLLVPRKPERFDEVARLDPQMVRRTQPRPDATGATRFLLDTMGELGKAYALADVVVVGRSFVPLGGSDPIEPIALGRPTIIGPHHDNFADVVTAFRDAGGILVTDQPGDAIRALLADCDQATRLAAAGREVIRTRQGATRRHADLLLRLLPSTPD